MTDASAGAVADRSKPETWTGEKGFSPWHVIDQETVDRYAVLTGDGEGEWVHLDRERAARELPYGGTIVPGFLQVAHLTKLFGEALTSLGDVDPNHALNYGFDRLRFVTPLPVGARFRAKFQVKEVRPHPSGGYVVKQDAALEKEDGGLTLAAEWLFHLSDRAIG